MWRPLSSSNVNTRSADMVLSVSKRMLLTVLCCSVVVVVAVAVCCCWQEGERRLAVSPNHLLAVSPTDIHHIAQHSIAMAGGHHGEHREWDADAGMPVLLHRADLGPPSSPLSPSKGTTDSSRIRTMPQRERESQRGRALPGRADTDRRQLFSRPPPLYLFCLLPAPP